MKDTACLKTPFVVCHAFDCRFVFAGERNACQTTAVEERLPSDVRHARRNRHALKPAAISERRLPDARHALRDRHRRQSAAAGERPTPDARHARRDRHRRQSAAAVKHITTDARHCASDFNCLKFFYPIAYIIIIQSGIGHRLLCYLARPVIFLDAHICKSYFRLRISSWF